MVNKMSQTKVEAPFVANNANFRNLFINGDMSIAQRATSATGLTGSSYPTIDRMAMQAASAGTWTQSQSTDVPTGQGFAKSLKIGTASEDAVCLYPRDLGLS